MLSLNNLKNKEITLVFSQDCQLNCVYCNQKHSKINMTKIDIKKIIKKYNFKSINQFKKNDYIIFEIFGGEPFNEITVETLDYLLWYLKNFINKNQYKKIFFKINTNGLFFNDYLKKLLIFINKNFNLKFLISFDGLWQDLRSSNEEKNKIIENIHKYLNSCLIKNTIISMSYNGLDNQDLVKNFIYLKHLFPISNQHISWYLIREDFRWSEKKIKNYNYHLDEIIKYNIYEYLKIKIFTPYIKNKKFYLYKTKKHGCEAGVNRFTILPHGKLSACSLDNDFKIESKINFDLNSCKNCEIFDYCDKICPKKISDKICKLKKIEYKIFNKYKYYLDKMIKGEKI